MSFPFAQLVALAGTFPKAEPKPTVALRKRDPEAFKMKQRDIMRKKRSVNRGQRT